MINIRQQKPIAAAVVVPSSTTTKANKRDAVAQELFSAPTLGINERQATTAEPISSADEITSPMSEEDLGFSEELLEEEEQPEEVVEARVGEDVYARAW
ncbi:MAG TPA: hypothetical protein VE288_18030 [Rubrobacteraceae bacterium]|jgi:hypothetical protein|nr:hypothetical protein [Rubrobacteraceae bacterium]